MKKFFFGVSFLILGLGGLLYLSYLESSKILHGYTDPCKKISIGQLRSEVENILPLHQDDGQLLANSPCLKGVRYNLDFDGFFFWERLSEIVVHIHPAQSVEQINWCLREYGIEKIIQSPQDTLAFKDPVRAISVYVGFPEAVIALKAKRKGEK
jgi:hypothetical protein